MKNAIKWEQTRTCSCFAEREHFIQNKLLIHKSSPKLGEVSRSDGGVCGTAMFDTLVNEHCVCFVLFRVFLVCCFTPAAWHTPRRKKAPTRDTRNNKSENFWKISCLKTLLATHSHERAASLHYIKLLQKSPRHTILRSLSSYHWRYTHPKAG